MSWKDFVDDSIGSMPLNPTIANVCCRESNLKDLQKSYECAKTYTLLVKQELARIPSRR
ncbi:MAG: hypothetical protein IJB89_02875 [Akkermansia sp.]|nr:hypothetical protein [Akkermansia sp.]